MAAPIDNLVRAYIAPEACEMRADDMGGNTMFGHFAVFDQWTEIHSWFEGDFVERIAKGAFVDTFASRAKQIRVLYDHGADPQIGNKPLGAPEVLREDKTGAYYEVPLFDATYVNDLKPALRAGQLGASFRFRVTAESWVEPSKASKSNPQKLAERTIEAVDLYEFGPVTFPAYAGASAGLRSGTDHFYDRLMHDPVFLARMTERLGLTVVEKMIADAPADSRAETETPQESADGDDAAIGRSTAFAQTQLLQLVRRTQ